jgi:acylphosphatase
MQANITIKGLVQGVFFRAHGQKEAQRLGLSGWIKNNPDGSVSASIQGSRQAIENFIKWCKEGPKAAKVGSVNVEWMDEVKRLEGFEIKY